MKLGVSSYSLHQAVAAKEMTFLETISWAKNHGGDHFEIVPLDFDLVEQPELISSIRLKAKEEAIELSNYAISANFIRSTTKELENEIIRVKKHVDVAHALGVRFMRHDAATRPLLETSIFNFHRDLPEIVNACREIADYANGFGITTSVENHGFYLQASERIQLLVELVDRENFGTTLDIGNFLCVDEDPEIAVVNNLPYATFIHIKDFYRRNGASPGDGWFSSKYGNHLRGAIAGNGDIKLREILRIIKNSDYGGFLSLEFEGVEDCRFGSEKGLENVRRIWDEI